MQCETRERPDESGDDDDLVARMNRLTLEHRVPLLRFLTRLTSREYSAEDFVQETMWRAWRNFPCLPSDAAGQRRWLFVVARRLVIDSVRRGGSRPTEVSLAYADHGVKGQDEVLSDGL